MFFNAAGLKPVLHYLCLAGIVLLGFAATNDLARNILPLGEGPDELSHLDNVFFRFARPDAEIRVKEGILTPGLAPSGQGHQAPLAYKLHALLLGLELSAAELGPFWDYQAGLWYSSSGALMGGGADFCNIRVDSKNVTEDASRVQSAIKFLRSINAGFHGLVILFSYLAARMTFSGSGVLSLATAVLVAGTPNAVWLFAFVTNDNLVSLLSTITFVLCIAFLCSGSRLALLFAVLAGVAAFWSKYTGLVCLAMVMGAVLLRPGLNLRRRALMMLLVGAGYCLLIMPHLYENYRIEGEALLSGTIARSFFWLYHPRPLGELIIHTPFLGDLLSGFWLEFDNRGYPGPDLDPRYIHFWWYLSLVGGIGLLALFLRPVLLPELRPRTIVLSWLSILAALTLVIYLAVSFPLPNARYLHTVLTPVALLVTAGVAGLARLLRLPTIVVLLINAAACGFGIHTTYDYNSRKYEGCTEPTRFDAPAGAAFGAVDIDGDGVDELYAFHQFSVRFFFLQKAGETFELRPEFTRSVGLQGDSVLPGDFLRGAGDDLLLLRRNHLIAYLLRGENFRVHNEDLAVYPERAYQVHPASLYYSGLDPEVQILTGDFDGRPGDEIVLYNAKNAMWFVFKAMEEGKKPMLIPFAHLQFGGSRKQAFRVSTPTGTLAGAYDKRTGTLYLGNLSDKRIRYHLSIAADREVRALDVNGDGLTDILTWKDGDNCLGIYLLEMTEVGYSLAEPYEVCLAGKAMVTKALEDQAVFPIRLSPNANELLAVANKRSGQVLIYEVHLPTGERDELRSPYMAADFGFLRPEERRSPLRFAE